jgi:hypothetical protein
MLCVCLMPHGYLPTDCAFHFRRWSFQIVYWLYAPTVINTFMLAGTWLTVTMAVVRFAAISYPFGGVRRLVGPTGSRIKVVLVFVVSFLMNVPRLFERQVTNIRCKAAAVAVDFRLNTSQTTPG